MRNAKLKIEDSHFPCYFWLYLNLKQCAEADTGGLLLYMSNFTDLEENDVLRLLSCLLRGRSIKAFYEALPDTLKSKFAFPRYNLETWK